MSVFLVTSHRRTICEKQFLAPTRSYLPIKSRLPDMITHFKSFFLWTIYFRNRLHFLPSKVRLFTFTPCVAT